MNNNLEEKFKPLQEKLGVTFKDPHIVEQAFVHRSYLNESRVFPQSNERLEFFGDAIISFVVALNLFQKFPTATEGDLTNYRASLVSRKFLGGIGIQLELGKYLYLAKGEEDANGRNNATILSNTFEALIGAIFLDQGIATTTDIIERFILSAIDDIITQKLYRDHKSALQEAIQSKYHKPPLYKVIKEEGPEHAKIFTVAVYINDEQIGVGQGKNKQEAEQQAANEALNKLSA